MGHSIRGIIYYSPFSNIDEQSSKDSQRWTIEYGCRKFRAIQTLGPSPTSYIRRITVKDCRYDAILLHRNVTVLLHRVPHSTILRPRYQYTILKPDSHERIRYHTGKHQATSAKIIRIKSMENPSINLPAHVPPAPAFPVVDGHRLTRKPSHSNELPDSL